MLKIKKELNKYCRFCNKHHIVNLKIASKNKIHKNRWIERQKIRADKRGNKGKYSRLPKENLKKTKRPNIVYTCKVTNKSFNKRNNKRIKLFTITK